MERSLLERREDDIGLGTVLAWFAAKGIEPETVGHFNIQVGKDKGVIFPYDGVDKIRYGIPTGTRSFRWEKHVSPMLFNRKEAGKSVVFLCEGETDTMRLWQALRAHDNDAGVVGLPGINTWNADMARDLAGADNVYVVLDNEADYNIARRVDEAYREIHRSLGAKARRITLPRGYNDICDFFLDHSYESFQLLVERVPQPGESRFRTLDLTQEPPMPTWVIENFICKGDLHLLIGEPNIGKSWITMAMSVAIAKGAPDFLGYKIPSPGRILYFDEENPEDLVFHRFIKLGLDKASADNIRYVSNYGLRLDHDPQIALDEALDYQPSLIVLDSLTRYHGEDENSAGAMADLFNSAIKPLARETGAAVIVIHHVNKSDSSSSFKRARGSGDITAFPDAGFDVSEVPGGLAIKNFKSRREAQSKTRYISIVDTPDGGVELLSIAGISGVF